MAGFSGAYFKAKSRVVIASCKKKCMYNVKKILEIQLYANNILLQIPSVLDFEKSLLLICKDNGYIINR